MNINQNIELLKKEVETNKAANAVFHMFALRRRARYQVTLSSLIQKMHKEGFTFSKDEYSGVLRLIARYGFGVEDIDSKGRLRGIKGIKVTLQSIGKAVCGSSEGLKSFTQRNHFTTIVPKPQVLKDLEKKPKTSMKLVVSVNDKPIELTLPSDMTREEISELVVKFM